MFLFGVPGRGMLRRMVTLVLCGVAFWGGSEVQRAVLIDRCIEAGGTVDVHGLCFGLPR